MEKIYVWVSVVMCLTLIAGSICFANEPNDKEDILYAEEGETVEVVKDEGISEVQKRRADLLTWKIRYWQQFKRNIEFEYTASCYKDKRFAQAVVKLDVLNRELKQLLVGGK